MNLPAGHTGGGTEGRSAAVNTAQGQALAPQPIAGEAPNAGAGGMEAAARTGNAAGATRRPDAAANVQPAAVGVATAVSHVAAASPAAVGGSNPMAHAAQPGLTGGRTGAGGAASAGETFAALDGEGAAPPATWIHAGTRQAEAGYLDPALGWVGVRAEAAGTAVHAAIVPGSAEAAAALGSHMGGLGTYLSEHNGHPAQVTLAAPEEGFGASAGNHAGAGAGPGSGGDAPRGERSGVEAGGIEAAPLTSARPAAAASADAGARAAPGTGGLISVMA